MTLGEIGSVRRIGMVGSLVLTFGIALLPAAARAQETVPPQGVAADSAAARPRPTPEAPIVASPTGTAGTPPLALPPGSSPFAYVLAERTLRLRWQATELRAANRAWGPPAAILGLGVASMIVGGVVFAKAWSETRHECYGSCDDGFEIEENVAMDRTGLVLMPLGALLVVISTPILIVRLARAARLRRTERMLELLGARFGARPSAQL